MIKVFDKTEKGREEISTRKYHLAPRLRSLLVMVDGKQAADELLKKVAGIGLTEDSLSVLLDLGFIQEAAPRGVTVPTMAEATRPPLSRPTHQSAPQASLQMADQSHQAVLTSKVSTPVPAPEHKQKLLNSLSVLLEGQTQFESIYRFYNETIKSTIGLRGYGLQLKVEKAGSIVDFRLLRKPYLEAVFKAQGREMARSLRDRLDQLLYLGEEMPQYDAINGLGD